ncbi:MAG: hypothetical protein NT069_35230 [Planctomycetota bacterium]|nr:hypothetical protein [Planctomycetota bacterium]
MLQHSTTHLWRFFAGFCLVTNGLYLAVGVWWGVGDAGDLVRQGSPSWTLLAFGVATVPLGFALWNGQSGSFGLGPHPQPVSWRQAWTAWCVLIATLVAEFQFSG